MTDPQASSSEPKPGAGFHWGTLKTLSRHLWPAGHSEMKLRVVIALILLALAKLAEIYTPHLMKQIIDVLGGTT